MELKEFVKKYQIAVCQDGKDRKIRADSSIARCPSDIEYLKSHKTEIIQYLDSEFVILLMSTGGLNLALRASNNEIYREAGKYCNHDLKTEYQYTYTQDGRKKLIRTISCAKCQLYIRDIVEEHREYNGN